MRGRKDAAHIRSLSELSRRLREVDLDIAYMLERNKRYKDGGVTKSSNMLTAINHLKVVIQAANEIVAKYQPLLNEHAAVEEAQEGEVDCDV